MFLPLGGSGEIGMNLNLYGYQGQWLMVDLGAAFADAYLPGVDLLFPDITFIEDRREDLAALVLTHGHEDHIGAVAHLWPRLRCPIYATPFTAALVRAKLDEAGLLETAEVREMASGGSFDAGPFNVTYVPIAHSIAEGHGLAIETPAARIYHTGDWKLDAEPIIGPTGVAERLTAIGEAGVRAMVGDSTNVFNPAASGSETAVLDGLMDIVGRQRGRVVITTFASNVARLDTVGRVAAAHHRHLVCLGRSMHRVVAAAKATGYLADFPPILDEDDAAHLPRNKMLVLCTGCQGESRAALSRLVHDEHRSLSLTAGDTVIFSSKIIPGNEIALSRIMNQLALRDIDTITERDAFIHVSGHPGRAELEQMYGWIRPEVAIPVHGEARHLKRHAEFARELGVGQAIAPKNGDIIRLAPGPAAIVDEAPVGRLALDGGHIVPLDSASLVERRRLMSNGHLVVTLVVDEDGQLIADPEVVARGVPSWEPDGALADTLIDVIEEAVERADPVERRRDSELAERVRIAARRTCRQETGKNAVTEVRVVRLEDVEVVQ